MPRARAWVVVALGASTTACGGGGPLLHPARTLPAGEVRAAGGVAAQIAAGPLSDDIRIARDLAARDPSGTPGAPGTNPDYAKGALVAAAVAPGLSPFVAARVGVGENFEGGLAYMGRGVRVDMRRSFDDGKWSYSVGLGLNAALAGKQQGNELPNVDLASLKGYGGDIPLLAGWESAGGIYKLWFGGRVGFERDVVETLTSEPKPVTIGQQALRLEANRVWGGALLGIAMGFNHLHVALELSAYYQVVSGSYNQTDVTVKGFTVQPSTALWWTF
ncbi:MAG: hypothetical protein JST00_30125 [Deltaproteobacteria bacterium]|nr:hypothetical protein [Deltaproteobacteria bacterium]